MKNIILLSLFLSIVTMEVEVNLGDIKSIQPKENFLNLEEDDTKTTPNGYPISLSYCMDQTEFKVQRYAIVPKEIIPNNFTSIKVHGSALRNMTITKLSVTAKLNNITLLDLDQKQDPERLLGEGDMYIYSFKIFVPVFVPSGSWNIYFNLKEKELDEKGEGKIVSCVLIHFDVQN